MGKHAIANKKVINWTWDIGCNYSLDWYSYYKVMTFQSSGTSVLRYSAICVSQYTINKLFDTILYHYTIMKWSWLVLTGTS